MSLLRSLSDGLRSLFRKERVEGELDEELRGFLEMAAEEKIKQGMSRKDALRAVRLEQGSVEITKEVVRSAGWESFVETCWQDLRFATRMLRKNPGFTAVAVLTLALGIGANTAIFTIFDAVLLESLPVREPSRLVLFTDDLSEGSYSGDPPSKPLGCFFRPRSPITFAKQPLPFESLAAFRSGEDTVNCAVGRLTICKWSSRASPGAILSPENYFSTMGVDSVMGRTLSPEDDRPNAPPVAVASYGYWKQRLHGDPTVFGKTAYLNGSAFTIVGRPRRRNSLANASAGRRISGFLSSFSRKLNCCPRTWNAPTNIGLC